MKTTLRESHHPGTHDAGGSQPTLTPEAKEKMMTLMRAAADSYGAGDRKAGNAYAAAADAIANGDNPLRAADASVAAHEARYGRKGGK